MTVGLTGHRKETRLRPVHHCILSISVLIKLFQFWKTSVYISAVLIFSQVGSRTSRKVILLHPNNVFKENITFSRFLEPKDL